MKNTVSLSASKVEMKMKGIVTKCGAVKLLSCWLEMSEWANVYGACNYTKGNKFKSPLQSY